MPATIQVVDGRTVIQAGENAAEAARQADAARFQADRADAAASSASAASLAAQAFTNFKQTRAEGVSDIVVGGYFSSAETGELRLYKRIAGAPGYEDMGDNAVPVNKVVVDGKAPIAGLPRNGTGVAKTALGGFHTLPATTPGGDDAPNVVIGSLGAVDLPADTYGNIISGPRDNDVSGGTGYRNRLGPNTSLAVILGGDNDIDALAAFNIGHHNRADATGGGTPSHPTMIGTYLVATGAYGIAMGTNHRVYSTKASAVGGDNNRIGTEASPNTARNSFAAGGYTNTIDGQYAGTWAGNECKASKDYTHASGLKAVCNNRGERAHSSISFSTPGDCQHGDLHLARTITGGVMTQLLLDGTATAILALGSGTLLNIDALINVVRTDAVGNTACYRLVASISNLGGTLSVKSQTLTVLHEDDATWNADVSVTAAAWQIRVAAGAGQTVRASAHVKYNLLRL